MAAPGKMVSRGGYVQTAFAACFQWSRFVSVAGTHPWRRIKGKWWLGTLSPPDQFIWPRLLWEKRGCRDWAAGQINYPGSLQICNLCGHEYSISHRSLCLHVNRASRQKLQNWFQFFFCLNLQELLGLSWRTAAALLCSAVKQALNLEMGQDCETQNVWGDLGLLHFSCHLDLVLLMRLLAEGKGERLFSVISVCLYFLKSEL